MINSEDFTRILLIIIIIIQLLALYFSIPWRLKQKIARFFSPPRPYKRRGHDIS